MNVLLFFATIGSSNLKHIVRFLLWRINNQNVKIDAQPVEKLFSQVKALTGIDLLTLEMPFYWNSYNSCFYKWISQDSEMLFSSAMREKLSSSELAKSLLSRCSPDYIASITKVRRRSIKRWSAGTRQLSLPHYHVLLDASLKNGATDILRD